MTPERQLAEVELAAASAAPTARRWRNGVAATAVAAGLGAILQPFVPRGNAGAAAVGAGSTLLFIAVAAAMPGRARRSLVQQEGFAAVLAAIAVASIAGSLVAQGQAPGFYLGTYGDVVGRLILGARLDDAFHSPWFSSLAGIFCAAVVLSALQRWPPSLRNLGFHLTHLGLLVALAGAALSAAFAVRGRVELRAGGEDARFVHADPPGHGQPAALGFALRLERFDVERYGSELRIGCYERAGEGWRLRATFDPEPGVRHRLPRGGGFVFRALSPGPPPAASVVLSGPDGSERDEILAVGAPVALAGDTPSRSDPVPSGSASPSPPAPAGGEGRGEGADVFLVLEKRPDDVKVFRSQVSAVEADGTKESATVEVNAPFRHRGWTFYQTSWDPRDSRVSGFQAVRDPGAFWVLLGFAVIASGVIHVLYVEPRLRATRE